MWILETIYKLQRKYSKGNLRSGKRKHSIRYVTCVHDRKATIITCDVKVS